MVVHCGGAVLGRHACRLADLRGSRESGGEGILPAHLGLKTTERLPEMGVRINMAHTRPTERLPAKIGVDGSQAHLMDQQHSHKHKIMWHPLDIVLQIL